MPQPVAVLNVVGLASGLIGEHTPRIAALARRGAMHLLQPILPAVTCSAQATMLTGLPPREHGIVGNGWYNRELNEVQFWKQSNALVHGEKLWETARRRDPSVTCANCFWWYAMYSTADVTVTPRPMYPADGRKIPDVWTNPPEWRDELQERLGPFPLFKFWGPGASIESSEWIARSAIATHERFRPTLTLVYLPHLDYCLQRVGPNDPSVRSELGAVDALVGTLLDHFDGAGVRTMLVSEYGIGEVRGAVAVNVALRQAGYLAVRHELGREQLDAGASRAFAVVDHQLAHVYVRHTADLEPVRALLSALPGVEQVLDRAGQAAVGLDHPRSGELVLVSDAEHWFSYPWWLKDAKAPDFARTVDIHRKPGYDPAELFIDPTIAAPKLKIATALFKRRLGFRALLDVVPLDASLVRGSHGRIPDDRNLWPVLIAPRSHGAGQLPMAAVRDAVLEELFG